MTYQLSYICDKNQKGKIKCWSQEFSRGTRRQSMGMDMCLAKVSTPNTDLKTLQSRSTARLWLHTLLWAYKHAQIYSQKCKRQMPAINVAIFSL